MTLSGRFKLEIPANVMIEWPSQGTEEKRVSLAEMRGSNGVESRPQMAGLTLQLGILFCRFFFCGES